MQPLLTNERARREWEYIVARVGEARALEAIARLGNRKPFPINIARALKLDLPEHLAEDPPAPPPPEIRKRLAELKAMFERR